MIQSYSQIYLKLNLIPSYPILSSFIYVDGDNSMIYKLLYNSIMSFYFGK